MHRLLWFHQILKASQLVYQQLSKNCIQVEPLSLGYLLMQVFEKMKDEMTQLTLSEIVGKPNDCHPLAEGK